MSKPPYLQSSQYSRGVRTTYPKPISYPPPIKVSSIISKEVNPENIEQLFSIVFDGDYNKIKNAIGEKNITLNITNANGQSLIHTVLENNSTGMKEDEKYELIKYLIDHGAPVSTYDKDNVTVLHLAAKFQYPKIVSLLLSVGMNANVVDASNMTSLHYAVQGNVIPCKPRKKVGSLIPKKIDKSVTTTELKGLAVEIVTLFNSNTESFKLYLSHIRSTLQNISQIYDSDFKNENNGLTTKISKLLADTTKSDIDKMNNVKQNITTSTTNLNKIITDKLKLSMKPLDIGPQNLNGWGPTPDTKILPSNTPDYVNSTIEVKFKEELNGVFNSLNKLGADLTKNVSNNTILTDEIYEYIHYIILLNKTLRVNKICDLVDQTQYDDSNYINNKNNYKFKEETGFDVTDDELAKLILYDHPNLFQYYEINIIGDITIANDFLPKDISNVLRVERATTKDQAQFKASKQNNLLTAYELSDDRWVTYDSNNDTYERPTNNIRNPYVIKSITAKEAVDAYVNNVPIVSIDRRLDDLTSVVPYPDPDTLPHIDQRIVQQQAGDFLGTSYYYVSKFIFAIRQIKKHYDTIVYNLETLRIHVLENSYTYQAYQNIIPNIVLSIFNIFQCMLLADSEKTNIENRTSTIINEFRERFNQNNNHPYAYLFERVENVGKDIIKNIANIYANNTQLYDQLSNLINILNNIIMKINKGCGITYIKSFGYDFAKTKLSEYSQIFDITLKQLTPPPKNLDEYIKLFGQYGNDINLMKQLFYTNYCLYYDKDIPNYLLPTKQPTNIGQLRECKLSNKAIFTTTQITQPFTITDQIESVGYSTTNYYQPKTDADENFDKYNTDNKIILPHKNSLLVVGAKNFNNLTDPLNKSNSAVLSIGEVLDTHLYNIRFLIVQQIIEKLNDDKIPEIKTFLEKIGTYNWTNSPNVVLYTAIGKLADELIIDHIQNSLYRGITLNVQSNVSGPGFKPISDFNISQKNNDSNTNINELIDEVLKLVTEGPTANNFNIAMSTVNVMEDEERLDGSFQIYNPNYTTMSEVVEKQCYKLNPDTIKALLEHGVDVNKKDVSGSVPLIYAIDTLNKSVIDMLLSHKTTKVFVPAFKNNYGNTPKDHALNAYSHHIGSLIDTSSTVKEIIDRFTKPIYNNIKETLQKNKDFENNIIRYLDIIFPQLIIMYNNLLYFYAKSYVNKWTYEQQKKIEDLLLTHGILSKIDVKVPILQDFNNEIVKNSVNLDALNKKVIIDDEKKCKQKTQINNLTNMKDNLQKELDDLRKNTKPTKFVTYQITNLELKINDIQLQIDKLIGDNKKIDGDNSVINTNIDTVTKEIYDSIVIQVNEFIENKNYLGGGPSQTYNTIFNEVSDVYNEIFKHVIKKVSINKKYNGNEDYFLYDKMWQSVINDNEKLKNIYNIQLSSSLLEKKYITMMQNAKTKNDLQKINNDLSVIGNLYSSIFVPAINNMFELPQFYNTNENYMLSEVLDIFTHIVKNVLCANLYYAVIKTITKYLLQINTQNIHTVIENLKPVLKKHIIKTMPKQLVIIKTNIHANEIESHTDIKTDETLFQEIVRIITSNTYVTIQANSSLITNLNTYIFTYYKTVFDLVIPQMKNVIDNYSRFIINGSRIINMITAINTKSLTEMTN